jgi:hypothetical protein
MTESTPARTTTDGACLRPGDIAADDPELLEILRHLPEVQRRNGGQRFRPTTYSIPEIVKDGPAGATKVFAEIAGGRLRASYCGARRFVLAIDFARWLLLMRRETEAASVKAEERREAARARQLTPDVQHRREERRVARSALAAEPVPRPPSSAEPPASKRREPPSARARLRTRRRPQQRDEVEAPGGS